MIKKGRCHGARHGKTEEQKEYQIVWDAWKRAASEWTLKVNMSQVFTIAFLETKSIVNHNSQLAGQNQSAKSGTNLHQKTIHIVSLQRNSKIPRTLVSHLEKVRQKRDYATSTRFSSCSLSQKPSSS